MSWLKKRNLFQQMSPNVIERFVKAWFDLFYIYISWSLQNPDNVSKIRGHSSEQPNDGIYRPKRF